MSIDEHPHADATAPHNPAEQGDLSAASQPVALGEGLFTWQVPQRWQQGRGAFGGLTLAALTRAVQASEPDGDRIVRGLNAELCGPVLPGPACIRVLVLRRGNGVSTLSALLEQGGEVRASATLALGRGRSQERGVILTPPAVPPWQEAPEPVLWAPFMPTFARFLEYRVSGPVPYGGGVEALAQGWVRPRRPWSAWGAAELIALADAWWPGQLAVESAPRPMATLSFSLQFGPGAELARPGAPLLHQGRVLSRCDGFVVESRELWTESGALVSHNQQVFVLIR